MQYPDFGSTIQVVSTLWADSTVMLSAKVPMGDRTVGALYLCS